MVSTGIQSVFGAVFWIICSHIYDPEQIGLSTALISAVALIGVLSVVGLNTAFVRYIPTSTTRNRDIATGTIVVLLISLAIAAFYILFIDIFSPSLEGIRSDWIFLILFFISVVATSLLTLCSSIFVALRTAKYIVVVYSVLSIGKIVGSFIFGRFELGPYHSVMFSTMIALGVGGLILWKHHAFRWDRFSVEFINRVRMFSASNYATSLGSALPASLLPIIVLNSLGAEQSAYYYMAMMVANLLYIIPTATGQSLFAEGSNDPAQIKKHQRDTYRITASIMIPVMLFILVFGGYILTIFGHEYSDNGNVLLRFLTISGFFVSLNYIFTNVLRIQLRLKALFWVNTIGSFAKMGFVFLLIQYGLWGVGLAWLIGEALTTAMFAGVMWASRFRRQPKHADS